MNLNGIYTALLTPFDQNNKVNEKELERLVKHNVKMGVDGFYVGGSTAEAFLLTTEERKQIMDVVKAIAPDKTLIAHIGTVHEDEAHLLAKHAEKIGYDVISSVAPYYYKFSFNEIKDYYYRLAYATELSMLVYHFPAFSGVNMTVANMAEFLKDDKFVGIKFTSNDFFMLEQCKAAFPDKIVYNGFDEMFLAGLSMGADGGVGSTYNLMADKFVEIRRLFMNGEMAKAQALQKEVNRIIAVLCKIGVMASEKEVMNQLGMAFGAPRKPFAATTAEQNEMIAKEIMPFITPLEV